ncbi:MAG: bis(5'-nucleosyl)-tetraphosphatase (symmetrical) YqeK [Clostridiales bacterium]|jgi:nicotinate-nucleotide adenylyltransferase|nr:bis(5'-nucleosyl)-tetraphosphatase (symmetrical) YqeK [Clostridiales bacterium]
MSTKTTAPKLKTAAAPPLKTPAKTVAIFGGSFDPVHTGHRRAALGLCRRFDSVIAVPGLISPFKIGAASAPAADRLAMLSLAFSDIKGVEISDCELVRGGVSYSIDTVKYFRKIFDGGVKLYFCIGSEMLGSLSAWKDFSELCRLCSFYVMRRKGFVPPPQTLSALKSAGASTELSEDETEDISSALARAAVAFELPGGILDPAVYDYIKTSGLYAEYAPVAALAREFNLGAERTEHTLRACKTAIALAKRHGAPVNKAVLAVLLHDIGKNADSETLKKRGLNADEFKNLPQKVVHAPVGALIARECAGVTDPDILNAIFNHTSGAPNMSVLEKIVYLADSAEDGRDYNGVEQVRAAAYDDLDKAMELALKISIDSVRERGIDLYYKTAEAYEYYKKLNVKENAE